MFTLLLTCTFVIDNFIFLIITFILLYYIKKTLKFPLLVLSSMLRIELLDFILFLEHHILPGTIQVSHSLVLFPQVLLSLTSLISFHISFISILRFILHLFCSTLSYLPLSVLGFWYSPLSYLPQSLPPSSFPQPFLIPSFIFTGSLQV